LRRGIFSLRRKFQTGAHRKKKSKPGMKFLVIYDTENPKESIIRLDYPIKDSTDFRRYVKEFEQKRKQKEE